jgi:hypothetical protein
MVCLLEPLRTRKAVRATDAPADWGNKRGKKVDRVTHQSGQY